MQSALNEENYICTTSNSSSQELQGTGGLVLVMPELNARKSASRSRQMSSKMHRSSSSSRSASSRSVIQCTVCSKTFNNSSALAKHKLIHSEERRYICNQCSKSFKRQDHLNGHIMTHSSKKPYECKYVGCDKSYCDARSLRRHLEHHHQPFSSAASDGILTPKSATDLQSAGQPMTFSFDFVSSPGQVDGQNVAADSGVSSGLSHSQSSPTISTSCSDVTQPSSLAVWMGGVNPLAEPLPVPCSFCDRRFRNLAALNGHMRLHGGYVKKDAADEAKLDMEFNIQLSESDSLSSADVFPCSIRTSSSSDAVVFAKVMPDLSKDAMLSDSVGVEDGGADGSTVDREMEETDWFGSRQVMSDDLGMLSDGLDMVDMEDCPSTFPRESACNTIDFDTIVDLGLNTTDVSLDLGTRNCVEGSFDGQPEVIPAQLCFTTSQPVNSVLGDSLLQSADCKDASSTVAGLGIRLVGHPDALTVPSCLASNVSQLSSVKFEQTTSFLTPKTPTHSQGLPTHFSFSSPDTLLNSPVSKPKTPVVSVSLPARAPPQLSPHTPYTPETPSIFQFPSPNQSPAGSTGCSPASRHSKRHTANYHPYSSPSSATSSSRYQPMAAAQQLEQQKRLEIEVAEAHNEIDQYIHRLRQADLQHRQQLEMPIVCPKETSSKLSLTLTEETGTSSDTQSDRSTNAVVGKQVVSPIDEVIQILVAEHFGVTIPSKFLQDGLKSTARDSKDHSEQLTSDNVTGQHPAEAEEFRNPDTLPMSKPKKHKPKPLVIPASVSNFGFRSQLRSPKLCESGGYATLQCQTATPPPYTPPPMISPARSGSGVFWTLHGARQIPAGPQSAPPYHTSLLSVQDASQTDSDNGLPPLTDIEPHINIGHQYQADLASVAGEEDANTSGTLVWDPKVVENLTDEELKSYQNFACSANIRGSRANHEYALHLLQMCNGHIKAAQKKLLQRDGSSGFIQHGDEWSQQEMEIFSHCLRDTNKDFSLVAKQVGTKSVKQCVEFYYVWKKVCEDDYRLLCKTRKQQSAQLNTSCSDADIGEMKNQGAGSGAL